jgi:hypothetical protein
VTAITSLSLADAWQVTASWRWRGLTVFPSGMDASICKLDPFADPRGRLLTTGCSPLRCAIVAVLHAAVHRFGRLVVNAFNWLDLERICAVIPAAVLLNAKFVMDVYCLHL